MDIVERLRAWNAGLYTEAADKIESLRDQLASCQKERDECESKWNMTADALVMATGQIGSLVAALEQVKHDAESQRVWNGTGWSYRYPFGRIHDTATAALEKVGADKGEK